VASSTYEQVKVVKDEIQTYIRVESDLMPHAAPDSSMKLALETKTGERGDENEGTHIRFHPRLLLSKTHRRCQLAPASLWLHL
jgi:hypothetical protein